MLYHSASHLNSNCSTQSQSEESSDKHGSSNKPVSKSRSKPKLDPSKIPEQPESPVAKARPKAKKTPIPATPPPLNANNIDLEKENKKEKSESAKPSSPAVTSWPEQLARIKLARTAAQAASVGLKTDSGSETPALPTKSVPTPNPNVESKGSSKTELSVSDKPVQKSASESAVTSKQLDKSERAVSKKHPAVSAVANKEAEGSKSASADEVGSPQSSRKAVILPILARKKLISKEAAAIVDSINEQPAVPPTTANSSITSTKKTSSSSVPALSNGKPTSQPTSTLTIPSIKKKELSKDDGKASLEGDKNEPVKSAAADVYEFEVDTKVSSPSSLSKDGKLPRARTGSAKKTAAGVSAAVSGKAEPPPQQQQHQQLTMMAFLSKKNKQMQQQQSQSLVSDQSKEEPRTPAKSESEPEDKKQSSKKADVQKSRKGRRKSRDSVKTATEGVDSKPPEVVVTSEKEKVSSSEPKEASKEPSFGASLTPSSNEVPKNTRDDKKEESDNGSSNPTIVVSIPLQRLDQKSLVGEVPPEESPNKEIKTPINKAVEKQPEGDEKNDSKSKEPIPASDVEPPVPETDSTVVEKEKPEIKPVQSKASTNEYENMGYVSGDDTTNYTEQGQQPPSGSQKPEVAISDPKCQVDDAKTVEEVEVAKPVNQSEVSIADRVEVKEIVDVPQSGLKEDESKVTEVSEPTEATTTATTTAAGPTESETQSELIEKPAKTLDNKEVSAQVHTSETVETTCQSQDAVSGESESAVASAAAVPESGEFQPAQQPQQLEPSSDCALQNSSQQQQQPQDSGAEQLVQQQIPSNKQFSSCAVAANEQQQQQLSSSLDQTSSLAYQQQTNILTTPAKQDSLNIQSSSLGVFTPDSSTNSVHSMQGGSYHQSGAAASCSQAVMESPNSISSVDMSQQASTPTTPANHHHQIQQTPLQQQHYSEQAVVQQQQLVQSSCAQQQKQQLATACNMQQQPHPSPHSTTAGMPAQSPVHSNHNPQSLPSQSPHSHHNMTSPAHPQMTSPHPAASHTPAPTPQQTSPHPMTISPAAHSPYPVQQQGQQGAPTPVPLAHTPQPSPTPTQQQQQQRAAPSPAVAVASPSVPVSLAAGAHYGAQPGGYGHTGWCFSVTNFPKSQYSPVLNNRLVALIVS